MVNLSTMNVFASEPVQQEDLYFIINDEIIVTNRQDYENPETGEYYRWETNENARADIVKTFSF